MKQKPFGPVFVKFDGSDTLQYAGADVEDMHPCPPTASPVDTLLASLAACIVLSIQWAADQRKTDLNPFVVEVSGLKAADLPGRLERADIRVIGNIVEDQALEDQIIRQAKSICTVSNTLNCAISIAKAS